jgi:hypothetical protein
MPISQKRFLILYETLSRLGPERALLRHFVRTAIIVSAQAISLITGRRRLTFDVLPSVIDKDV